MGDNAVLLLNVPPIAAGLIHENDAARLHEFGQWIRETFRTTCALGPRLPPRPPAPVPADHAASRNTVDGNPTHVLDHRCLAEHGGITYDLPSHAALTSPCCRRTSGKASGSAHSKSRRLSTALGANWVTPRPSVTSACSAFRRSRPTASGSGSSTRGFRQTVSGIGLFLDAGQARASDWDKRVRYSTAVLTDEPTFSIA